MTPLTTRITDMAETDMHERIATLEANMDHVMTGIEKLVKEVESLKSVIWRAVGGLGVLVVLLNFLFGKLS